VFAAIESLAVLQAQNVAHNRVCILIEACEESGSRDLMHYVEKVSQQIGSPSLVICLDSGCANYEQMWLTTSLRGMLLLTIRVKILEEAQHSGAASGIVPDTMRIMRILLERIENSSTGQLPSYCYCDIPAEDEKYAKEVEETVGEIVWQKFPLVQGAKPSNPKELAQLVLNNTWRPTLTYTGIDGIPALANAGNVLRSETTLKLSFRLPPTVDCATVGEKIKAELVANPPYGAEIEVKVEKAQNGWRPKSLDQWLYNSLQSASQNFYGKPVRFTGEGGSIPFMNMLGQRYPATQFVITGVLGPLSNAHGPNEFLHVEMMQKLTGCIASIVADHHEYSNK
jgi:acetylornithine deacetylase/succinyl-diaminopimelate desuccinylase-like protein